MKTPTSRNHRRCEHRAGTTRGATRTRAAGGETTNTSAIALTVNGLGGLEVTPAIDEYCRTKIGRACAHVDPREIRDVEVRCSARGGEGDRGGKEHATEVIVRVTRGVTVRADASGENLYATIDGAADKVARAMRKHKEKHSGKGARHASHEASAKDALIDSQLEASDDEVPPAA
jgi:putative sigma-54 modulation protein